MAFVCQLDGSVHETVQGVHDVLKRFRVKQETYWHEVMPRYNIVTGKLIPYKSFDQYSTQDFGDKDEIRAWIKKDPKAACTWAIEWLRKRREEKGLAYAPSQVELRTLMCPSKPYFDANGGYYTICRALGYYDRYTDDQLVFVPLASDAEIIQDTREQSPLKLNVKTRVKKLDYADYALAAPHDKGIYIERKSLSDCCGSICKGNERFRRELERATRKGHYIVMLVESKLADFQALESSSQTKNVKASSAYAAKQLRDLLTDFPFSFQAVFVDGRLEAARTLVKIFELGEQVKTIDLQASYEEGRL